jgi:sugar phosphate isomerase/epimerase
VTHTGAWGYWVQVPLLERPLVEVFPADVPPERLVVEIGPAPEGELSWSATARAAATDALHHALDWAKARKITLYLRPHAAHVVSDIPSTLALLRTHGSLRLAWDASALLAESMLPRRAEHLERMTHAFAGHPQLGCVVGDGPEGGESPMVASGQEVPRVWPG